MVLHQDIRISLGKKKIWLILQKLAKHTRDKWIFFGDFNDVFSDDKNKGGNCITTSQFICGSQAIDAYDLLDLGFEGYPFMQTNGRHGLNNIWCRLDKFLSNSEFYNKFNTIKVIHLPKYGCDCVVIHIDLEVDLYEKKKWIMHLLRFEDVWAWDSRCEGLVHQIQNTSNLIGFYKLQDIQGLKENFK